MQLFKDGVLDVCVCVCVCVYCVRACVHVCVWGGGEEEDRII